MPADKPRHNPEKLYPLHDTLVVRREKPEQKSTGGIVLPDDAQEDRNEGTVIKVGPGRVLDNGTHLKTIIRPGMRIIFRMYSVSKVDQSNEDYLFVQETDVLAIIED